METEIKIINGNRIGGCITVITWKETKIVIDFGEHLPGAEPTEEDLFFDWEREPVNAVFFTHYHGDHIGRLPEIPEAVPVYMGEVTWKVLSNLNRTLAYTGRGGQAAVDLLNRGKESGRIHFIEANTAVTVGPVTVTPYAVDHSAFDAYMFLVETPDTTILHTGDYRDHGHRGHVHKNGRDINVLLEVLRHYVLRDGRRPVDVLITEGTMMGLRSQEAPFSEKDLQDWATEYFKDHRHIFLKVSSTNVDSLASFCHAAAKAHLPMYANRYVIEQMHVYRDAGRAHGTHCYDFSGVKLIPNFSSPNSEETVRNLAESGFVILVSEYERYEQIIDRFSAWDPVLIYSLWEGYLNPGHPAYNKQLADFCSRYHTVHKHTGGHARRELIEQVINLVSPRRAILPIHTEAAGQFKELNIREELKERISYEK